MSSRATRHLLADLAGACSAATPCAVSVESVGGVEAARRVAAGEPFDLVVLASGAIEDVRRAVLARVECQLLHRTERRLSCRSFRRWGILDAVQSRIVRRRPVCPSPRLVTRGDAALGFQQLRIPRIVITESMAS